MERDDDKRKTIMKNDPFYLSEEASLGVLSVDGNFYASISTFFEFNFNLEEQVKLLNSYSPCIVDKMRAET